MLHGPFEPKEGRAKNKGFIPCFCECSKTALLRNAHGKVQDGQLLHRSSEPKEGRVKNKGFIPCFCECSKTTLLRNVHGKVQDGLCH